MQTLARPTLLAFCASAIAVFVACGGSSSTDATPNTGGAPASTGGNSNVGGKATGGANATGGSKATGGTTVTGGSTTMGSGGVSPTGGSKPTGGTTSPGTSATGGAAPTGGKSSAGGTATIGGSSNGGGTVTTGGSAATDGGTTDVAQMCDDVCTLLAGRSTPLSCVPSDCAGTCNSTYTKLNGANPVCATDYVALYQCGLAQAANDWSCYTVNLGTVNFSIPIPPSQATSDPCHSQYQALYTIIITGLTSPNSCAAAL